MATAKQFADWLEKNKAKQGTADYNKVLRAYDVLRERELRETEPEEIEPIEPTERAGFTGAFKEAATLIPRAGKEAAAYAAAQTPETRRALLEAGKSEYAPGVGFGEGQNWEAFKELTGGSFGALMAPITAATAGAVTPVPLAGPVAGFTAGATQYEIQNLMRQAQEQERAAQAGEAVPELELGKSLAASAAQAGLDVAGAGVFAKALRRFPLLRNLVTPGKTAKEVDDVLVDAFEKGTLRSTRAGIVRGVGKGVAFEVPQETAQQMLERWQAGLSLTGDDAKEEYKQAAIGAILLGAPLGGVAGAVEARADTARAARLAEERKPPPPETAGMVPETPPEGPAPAAAETPAVEITPDLRQKAIDAIRAEGKTAAGFLQNKLGIKLSEAKTLRDSLLADGTLVKKGIKWELSELGEEGAAERPAISAVDEGTTRAGVEVPVSGPPAEREGAQGAGGQGLVSPSVPPTDFDGTKGGVEPALTPAQKLEQYIETTPKINLGIRAVMKATGLSEAESKQALADLSEQGILVKGKQGFKLAEDIETAGKPVIDKEASLPEQLQSLVQGGYRPNQTAVIAKFFNPENPKSVARAKKHIEEGVEATNLIGELNTLVRAGRATPYTQGLIKRLQSEVINEKPPLNEARRHIQQVNEQKELIDNLIQLKEAGIPAADVALNSLQREGVTKEETAEIKAFVDRQFEQLGLEKAAATEAESREKAAIRTDLERKVEAAQRDEKAPPTLLSVAERDLRKRGISDEAVDVLGDVGETESSEVAAARERVKQKIQSARGEKRGSVEPAVDKTAAMLEAARARGDYEQRRVPRKERGVGLRFQRPRAGQGLAKSIVDKVVAAVTAGWTNAPKIVIVQSVNELPAEVADANPLAPGFYDSNTGTVYIVADNAVSESSVKGTVFHESLGHYGLEEAFGSELDKVLKDILSTNTAAKAEAAKWLESNPDAYKGLAPEARTVRALEEVFAERTEAGPIKSPGLRAAFNKIAALVRSFLRKMGLVASYSDNDIAQALQQAQDRVIRGVKSTAPSVKQGVKEQAAKTGPQVKQAKPATSASVQEMDEHFTDNLEKIVPTKKTLLDEVKRIFSYPGVEKAIRTFQNDRRPLKTLQDQLMRSGKLILGEKGFNNAYDMIIQSAQRTTMLMARHFDPLLSKIDQGLQEYAKSKNITIKQALGHIDARLTAKHEGERREVKFLRDVPLSINKDVDYTAQDEAKYKLGIKPGKYSAADLRAQIFAQLKSDVNLVTNGEVKSLRAYLNNLVATKADAKGSSPTGATSVDKNSDQYRVIGTFDFASMERMRKEFDNEYANNPAFKKIVDNMREMQKETKERNKEANFWTQQVDNLSEFYGWNYYVPFKGKPEVDDKDQNDFENGARRGREMGGEIVQSFGGRESDSENTLLQAQADAVLSAMRAGRKNAMEAIKNLIEQGHITADKPEVVEFKDKDNIDPNKFGGTPRFFYYSPDGKIYIYKITDTSVRESIRRAYQSYEPHWQVLSNITSGIGKSHTRYNPPFPVYNFVRDVLFNAYTLSAEGQSGMKYINEVATIVGKGGMFKAAKVSKLFAERKLSEIEALAAKDPFIRDIYEFMQEGGKSAYVQNFSTKSQMDEMVKSFNRGQLARTGETLTKWIDAWSDMFELTARAAAYSVVKSNTLAELEKQGKNIKDPKIIEGAKSRAAGHAKELTNFESVGEWGRKMGALYMFFRPAATGAVRAYDAIAPAFQDIESLVAALPKSIASDPQAVAKFRQDHEKRKRVASTMLYSMMGAGAALYIMALAAADDDDQGRNVVATDDMELWTRNLRLPMGLLGGGNDKFIQLPWGFGLGAFAAAGAQVTAALSGNSSLGDMGANLTTIFADSFMPLPVARFNPTDNFAIWVLDSVTPSFFRPALEFSVNLDGLGREIYRDRQNRYGDAYTASDNTPELYKDTARMLLDVTNGRVDVEPGVLHFWANNYFDGASRIAHSTRSIQLWLSGNKEFDPKTDTVLLDSFFGRKSSIDARQFSEAEERIKEMDSTMKVFKNKPEQLQKYLEREPSAPFLVNYYNKYVNGTLRDIRSAIKTIEASDLPVGERKERLKDLRRQRDFLMHGFVTAVEQY